MIEFLMVYVVALGLLAPVYWVGSLMAKGI